VTVFRLKMPMVVLEVVAGQPDTGRPGEA
jgi:hypothetical protein